MTSWLDLELSLQKLGYYDAETGLLRCEIELFIHFVWIYWNDPVSATSAENMEYIEFQSHNWVLL